MAIDSVGSNTNLSATQLFGTTSAPVRSQDTDGDGDGSRVAGPGGGKIANAIGLALSQLGITPANGTAASSSATDGTGAAAAAGQDPQQAASAFAHALFAAIHGQIGAQGGTDTTAAGADSGAPVAHHHHRGGGAGSKVESGLQNLIQQLSSGAGTGTGTSASGTAAPASGTAGTAGDALATLQSTFDSLLSANGGTGGKATLTNFLQTLAQDLQGASSAGNAVSTKA